MIIRDKVVDLVVFLDLDPVLEIWEALDMVFKIWLDFKIRDGPDSQLYK